MLCWGIWSHCSPQPIGLNWSVIDSWKKHQPKLLASETGNMKTQSGCGTSPAHKFLSGSHQHRLWICQARSQVLLSPRYLHIVHWPNGHSCPRSRSLKKMDAGMENTGSGLNLMGASWKSKYRCLLKSPRVALISTLFQAWVSSALESVDYLT